MGNIIYVIGEITWELYRDFAEKMNQLESNAKNNTVYLELASDGGNAHAALAFYSRIRQSRLTVVIEGTGNVASAAVLILVAGKERKLSKESWVMMHESPQDITGNTSFVSREMRQQERLEAQWCELLEKHCDLTSKELRSMHKKTTYLTPKQCLDLKLIEEIV